MPGWMDGRGMMWDGAIRALWILVGGGGSEGDGARDGRDGERDELEMAKDEGKAKSIKRETETKGWRGERRSRACKGVNESEQC
ncbi:MAG: hypothetical protein BYD32DRAFT_408687 [Podila humilis]|nr:MAG: hypothetical protein BYD32DRAFT_408687 [Podila humilis]